MSPRKWPCWWVFIFALFVNNPQIALKTEIMLKSHQNVQTHPNRREEKSNIPFFSAKQGSNSMTPPVSKIIQFRVGYRLLNKIREDAFFNRRSRHLKYTCSQIPSRRRSVCRSVKRPLHLVCFVSPIQVKWYTCNTLENCFFQISSFSHTHVRITYEKTSGEVLLGPVLGKQNVQEKEVY